MKPLVLVSALTFMITVAYAEDYVPTIVDYNDSSMWFNVENDSTEVGADVFYIPATWEFDWYTPDSAISHYADPSILLHREHMGHEMKGFAEMMGEGNNFYSPYYRHVTLNTWATLDENYIDSLYFNVSFVDIRNAFEHFLRSRQNNRPLVLAGFSQGAKSVVELLKVLPDSLWDEVVVAYVIGYKVTPSDTIECPYIVPANSADDIGVVVCYNSVEDVKCVKPIISYPNVACINPVNWSTKNETAILNDTVSVKLDVENKVLVVKGFHSPYKPVLGFINTGDLHSSDPWLYKEHLKENLRKRISRWYALRQECND